MPITTAHPLILFPLRRFSFCNFSALIIGSTMPDIIHFVPLPLSRTDTHSVAGSFLFSLPVGVLCFWLYHWIIKEALWVLSPLYVQKRLSSSALQRPKIDLLSLGSITVSLLIGIASHIAWDAFTHLNSVVVQEWLPFLQREVITVQGFSIRVHKVFQHTSSIFGSLIVVFLVFKRLLKLPIESSKASPRYSWPLYTLSLITVVPFFIPMTLQRYPLSVEGFALFRAIIQNIIFGGGKVLVVGTLLFALFWRLLDWRNRR